LDPWIALMRTLAATLNSMPVPTALQPILAQAANHWNGVPADLVEQKALVWQFIEAIGPAGSDLALADGRLARALLCILEPEGDAAARSDTAEWFAAMTHPRPVGGGIS
jgi:hypothetical protein